MQTPCILCGLVLLTLCSCDIACPSYKPLATVRTSFDKVFLSFSTPTEFDTHAIDVKLFYSWDCLMTWISLKSASDFFFRGQLLITHLPVFCSGFKFRIIIAPHSSRGGRGPIYCRRRRLYFSCGSCPLYEIRSVRLLSMSRKSCNQVSRIKRCRQERLRTRWISTVTSQLSTPAEQRIIHDLLEPTYLPTDSSRSWIATWSITVPAALLMLAAIARAIHLKRLKRTLSRTTNVLAVNRRFDYIIRPPLPIDDNSKSETAELSFQNFRSLTNGSKTQQSDDVRLL